jgi:flagellin
MAHGLQISALIAGNALNSANAAAAKASERISTTLRINSAADDPAGLAMANRLKSDISSYNAALANINSAISMNETADTALSSIAALLADMSALAVASSSDTASDDDRTNNQTEFSAYLAQIETIASDAAYNGFSLLDGSNLSMDVQTGINAGDTTSLTFFASLTSDLGTTDSLSNLDISSASGADTAITVIAEALSTVEGYQAQTGAQANVLAYQSDLTTSNITTHTTGYGNIMDADTAAETAALAAAEIRQTASTAMVAQANSMSKELVSYLLSPYLN